jgi:hypothetical protein
MTKKERDIYYKRLKQQEKARRNGDDFNIVSGLLSVIALFAVVYLALIVFI